MTLLSLDSTSAGLETLASGRSRSLVGLNRPTPLQALTVVGDVLILVGVYGSIALVFQLYSSEPFRLVTWCLTLSTVWLCVAVRSGAYHLTVLRKRFQSVYIAAKVTILAGAVFHLLPLVGGPVDSRIASATIVLMLTACIAVWRLLFSYVSPRPISDEPSDLLVIGTGPAAQALATAVAARPHSGFRIIAFVEPEPVQVVSPLHGVPVRSVGRLREIIRHSRRPPRVVLATSEDTHAAVYDELTALAQAGIEVVGVASVYEEATGCVPVWHLGNAWWAVLPRPSTDLLYVCVKRVADVAGAVFGMLVLLVLLPVVAPLLYVETRGSIFFRQVRIGRQGREFELFKLRTMPIRPTAFQDHWERKRGNYAARIGKLVRLLGIDELPQCWNVLKGEMSLVGPRPYVPDEVSDFQLQIPFFRSRALIRPGITGWAQVNWGYGLSIDDEVEKLQYDLYYIGHQSLYLDLLVLLRTVQVLVRGRRLRGTQTAVTAPSGAGSTRAREAAVAASHTHAGQTTSRGETRTHRRHSHSMRSRGARLLSHLDRANVWLGAILIGALMAVIVLVDALILVVGRASA